MTSFTTIRERLEDSHWQCRVHPIIDGDRATVTITLHRCGAAIVASGENELAAWQDALEKAEVLDWIGT
jgi:hypothetical protein